MRLRVMVADDHRMLREMLVDVLAKEADIEVVGEAADGRELMQLVREQAPDLVVLDIGMPGLNGIDTMSQLAELHPGVKVVCLSGYADKRYVLAMLRAGAGGYVIKAAAGTELLRAVRAVAEGRNYLCPEVASTVIGGLRPGVVPAGTAGAALLGRREREVLQLIAEGNRSSTIAKRLHISVATVDTHRRNIMRKLELHTVAELTKFAIREGLTTT